VQHRSGVAEMPKPAMKIPAAIVVGIAAVGDLLRA
jgi:hypothetical protein